MNLYIEAARIIKIIDDKKASIKSLVFASKYPNIRQLYALVCETLKYKSTLQKLVEKCNLHKDSSFHDKPFLSVVILYEYLLGQGLRNAGVFKRAILKRETKIDSECTALLESKGVSNLKELVSEDVITKTAYSTSLPRYTRVNLLNTTVQEVLAVFEEEGWILNSSCEDISNLNEDEFMVDPVLPDVLIFPPRTELHDHALFHSGSIVLQDRASCFPAHILNAPENSVIIDCCAAPGNKTSHIASLMANTGKIFAFDRDRPRLNTMKTLLVRVGVENAELFCRDFLSIKPDDPQFSDAEYILVDPSCSGSGIVTRLDYLTGDNTSKQRLTSLSNFQASLLKHALKFPNAKRVVYSTCSVHPEENEQVVEDVLNQVSESFALKKVFPDWTMRGFTDYPHGDSMIRVSTDKHLTNGFFVACFERIPSGDNSESTKGMNSEVNNGSFRQDFEHTCADEDVENANQQQMGKKDKKKKLDNKNKSLNQSCEEHKILKRKKRKEKQMQDTADLLERTSLVSDSISSDSISTHNSKKKKKEKLNVENQQDACASLVNNREESISKKKKKKRNYKNEDQSDVGSESRIGQTEESSCDNTEKRNKKHNAENENYQEDTSMLIDGSEKSKNNEKHKKKHKNKSLLDDCTLLSNGSEESISKKHTKKKHKLDIKSPMEDCDLNEEDNSSTHSSKKKKKKKHEFENESRLEQGSLLVNSDEENIKKKKKHRYQKEDSYKECNIEQTDLIQDESAQDKHDDKSVSCENVEDSSHKKAKKKKKKHSKTE